MNRGEPGKTSSVVGGFPQAVYADIRGLITASFCSTVAVVPLYDRALVRAVARAYPIGLPGAGLSAASPVRCGSCRLFVCLLVRI